MIRQRHMIQEHLLVRYNIIIQLVNNVVAHNNTTHKIIQIAGQELQLMITLNITKAADVILVTLAGLLVPNGWFEYFQNS